MDGGGSQFLGGEVEGLKEAWEAQQKYSSQPREGRRDGDEEQAPRFSLFRPSKGQKAISSVQASQERVPPDTVAQPVGAMPPGNPSQAASRVARPITAPQGRPKHDPGVLETAPHARPTVAVSNGIGNVPQLHGLEKRGEARAERGAQMRGRAAGVDDSFGQQHRTMAVEPSTGQQARPTRGSQNPAREDSGLRSMPNGQARRGSGGEGSSRDGFRDHSGRDGFSSGPGTYSRATQSRAEPVVINGGRGFAREGGTRGGVPTKEVATDDFPPGFGPPVRMGQKQVGGPEQAVQIRNPDTGRGPERGRQGDDRSHGGSGRRTGPAGERAQNNGPPGWAREPVPRGPTLENGGTSRQDSGGSSDAKEKALKPHDRPRPGFAPYRPRSFFLSMSSSEAAQAEGPASSEELSVDQAPAREDWHDKDPSTRQKSKGQSLGEAARAERNEPAANREGSRQSQGLREGGRVPRDASVQNRSFAGDGRNWNRETGYQGADLFAGAEGTEGSRDVVKEDHGLSGRFAAHPVREQDGAGKKRGGRPSGSEIAAEAPGKGREKLLQKLAEADEVRLLVAQPSPRLLKIRRELVGRALLAASWTAS